MKQYDYDDINTFLSTFNIDFSPEQIIRLFEKSTKVRLTDVLWESIVNIEKKIETVNDIKTHLLLRGLNPHLCDKTIEEIKEGLWYPPLILELNENNFVISGNIQFMVCRVFNLKPFLRKAELHTNNKVFSFEQERSLVCV